MNLNPLPSLLDSTLELREMVNYGLTSVNIELKSHLPDGVAASEKTKSCICGNGRNLNIPELLCISCKRWYHDFCIGFQIGKLLLFLTNYLFVCSRCTPTGVVVFKKLQSTFDKMCLTAVANLTCKAMRSGTNRKQFFCVREIFPYIEKHWEVLTTLPRRDIVSWSDRARREMTKQIHILFTYDEAMDWGPKFGLHSMELTAIMPDYESLARDATQGRLTITNLVTDYYANRECYPNKRKKVEAPKRGYPTQFLPHSDGFKYLPAERDPHVNFVDNGDISLIPGWVYRVNCPNEVTLAMYDKSPEIKISVDQLAVSCDQELYHTIRATHGVSRGVWYWEVNLDELSHKAGARVGWTRVNMDIEYAPGFDQFGYAWCIRAGKKVHDNVIEQHSRPLVEEDTLGILIVLPERKDIEYLPDSYKGCRLVESKRSYDTFFKVSDIRTDWTTRPLRRSEISFFRNGISQGPAYTNIYKGCYYPAMSLHGGAIASVNFGPKFKFPPQTSHVYRPMSDRAEEAICEQTMADVLYLIDKEDRISVK